MNAKDIMVRDVPIISGAASVKEAVQILRQNFGDESFLNAAPGLVVVNESGSLQGILSPLSVIRAMLAEAGRQATPGERDEAFFSMLCENLADKRVQDIMDWQPIWVTEEASALEVAQLFATHLFQRLPVVSEGKVVGIIYRSRLLFALARSIL
jgi:CBS domain-containing protein